MTLLGILLFYTYGFFAHTPYAGFYFNPTDGRILQIYLRNVSSLHPGDILVKVGDISFREYQENFTQPLFSSAIKAGDIVPITVIRNGVETPVDWQMPGFNLVEFRGRLFNIWWLAYIFWLFGFAVELFIRPRDVRWWLLIVANHLTGLWLMLGAISSWHIWASSILFHAIAWLLLPIYFHLNWIFPKPLAYLPVFSGFLLYTIALFPFFGALTQALPGSSYALAIILALAGSVVLQFLHFIFQPEQRNQIRLLVISALLAGFPIIALNVMRLFGETPPIAPLFLLAFLFLPVAYLYLIFRNQLGGLEIRVHRFISTSAFLIILATGLIVVTQFVVILPGEISALLMFVIPLAASVVSLRIYPSFQIFLEKNFLGIKLPYQKIQETYSERIITSTSIENLLPLLEGEVFPSLLVRQYAVLLVTNGKLEQLLAKNSPDKHLLNELEVDDLLAKSGIFLSVNASQGEWIRLILPLKVGGTTLGFWLLGKRDPDDIYHQTEIPILRSLANQTAIALSNILHAEQLQIVYQINVEKNEQERMHLALELHDSILNQLATLRNNINEENFSPKVQTSYEELTRRLREIVSNLRPPMLIYGLEPAIIELADNLMERMNDKVKIEVELQTGEERIPEQMELHLFRIVQEACENALRHANADRITIRGTLDPHLVRLSIEDNGVGIDGKVQINLKDLVHKNHFGIAGMVERAR